ncbi:ABC transporter, partial [Methylobacterium sp. GXS13]|uniref:ATP-binding cassette domain-containing protein n=1 Tax=Methylobacterium sp. GXS13 TaxID=1730094 RepID=UPI00071B8E76
MSDASQPAGTPPVPALFFARVERRYPQAEGALDILRGADLAIWPGELVALVAPSGAGKSTLLHLAGLLERPDGGEVYIGGRPPPALPGGERTPPRRAGGGFVYHFHHLLPGFSGPADGGGPQLIRGPRPAGAQARATPPFCFPGPPGRPPPRPAELAR